MSAYWEIPLQSLKQASAASSTYYKKEGFSNFKIWTLILLMRKYCLRTTKMKDIFEPQI
jgi:hypothetical protein